MVDPNVRHAALAARLQEATSSHDIEGVVDCFTDDYVNETPAHPARSFHGREQVRRNWEQIFATVPDITTTVLDSAAAGDQLWSEWEMRGHRKDGEVFVMRGAIILTVTSDGSCDRASRARFYLEPVDRAEVDADHAMQRLLGHSAS